MYTIAEKLTDYVIQNGNIKDEERSIYVYGFQVALEQTVCYVICFLGAIFLKAIPEGIIFFIVFVPLRSYAGGLHLNRYWSCLLLSCITFFSIITLSKYLWFPAYLEMICLIFLEIVILKLYPVENINRNVDIYENAQFKKRLKIFLMINIIIGIVFAITKQYIYLNTIFYTIWLITITMVIGKYKNVLKAL